MKYLFGSFILGLSLSVQANIESFFNSTQASQICAKAYSQNNGIGRTYLQFIKHNDKSVFYAFYKKGNSTVEEYDFNGSLIKKYVFEGRIQNINFHEDEVIFLADSLMFAFDKFNRNLLFKTRTINLNQKPSKYGEAYGVYVFNDIYYIAHGRYGVIPYDRKKGKLLPAIAITIPQPQSNHESAVTDIVGIDEKIFVSLDDVTLARKTKAFEGLIIYDLNQEHQLKTIPVNQKQEAYYMSQLKIVEGDLIISNLHLNFVHSLDRLERSKYMRPQRRIWKYPLGRLIGKGSHDANKIYGCFLDEGKNKLISGIYNY